MGCGALPLQSEEKHPPEQGQSELEAPGLPLRGSGVWLETSAWWGWVGQVIPVGGRSRMRGQEGYYGLLNPAGVSSSGQPPTAVPQAEGPASNEDTFCEPSAQH